jgi:hypothetical protein
LINSCTKFHITIVGVSVRYCRQTTSCQCLSDDSADISLYTQRNVVTNVEYFLEVFDVCLDSIEHDGDMFESCSILVDGSGYNLITLVLQSN